MTLRHSLTIVFYALFAAALYAAAALAPSLSSEARAGDRPVVVAELFTSQGCSSCPPAEAYLEDLAERADVIALEFHVDYWDYIGWEDPFAKKSYTDRQKQYMRALHSRYVYTPQIVIDGAKHVVGSDRMKVELAIRDRQDEKREADMPKVRVLKSGENALTVSVDGDPHGRIYDLFLITYDKEHRTEVKRGENRGRTLVNRNVVRDALLIRQWMGEDFEQEIPVEKFAEAGGWVLLLQQAGHGPIAAAEQILW